MRSETKVSMKKKKISTDLVINSMAPDQVRHFVGSFIVPKLNVGYQG